MVVLLAASVASFFVVAEKTILACARKQSLLLEESLRQERWCTWISQQNKVQSVVAVPKFSHTKCEEDEYCGSSSLISLYDRVSNCLSPSCFKNNKSNFLNFIFYTPLLWKYLNYQYIIFNRYNFKIIIIKYF